MNEEIRVFIADDEQRAIDTLSKTLNSCFTNVKIAGTATSVDCFIHVGSLHTCPHPPGFTKS